MSLRALQAFPADAIVETGLCVSERSLPSVCLLCDMACWQCYSVVTPSIPSPLCRKGNAVGLRQCRREENNDRRQISRSAQAYWSASLIKMHQISPRPSKYNRRSATGASSFNLVPWSNFLHLQLFYGLSNRPVRTSDLYWSLPLSAVEPGGFETICIEV